MAKQVQAVPVVGIDDGRAYTKLYAGPGKQLKIRTSVRAGMHAGTSGLSSAEDQESGAYEANGQRYSVGDRIDGEDTRFEDFDGSVINVLAIHHALVRAGFGGQKVAIATGLPVRSYYMGGSINMDIINAKREKLMRPVVSMTKQRPVAEITSNVVASEALAAWFDDVLDDDGQMKPGVDMTNPVGIVDFGGRTFDTLWVNPPDQINHSRSGSETIGVLDLFDLVQNGICAAHDLSTVSRSMLETAVTTKKIRLYGEQVDVSDIVKKAGEEICDRIEREIKRRFGSAAELERILFVGGGVAALPQIADRYRNAVAVKEPEFANARGMYKFLRHSQIEG